MSECPKCRGDQSLQPCEYCGASLKERPSVAVGTYMVAEEYDPVAMTGIAGMAASVTFGPRAYVIHMRKGGSVLGTVKYFKRWKQFVFQPEEMTEFSPDCLAALADFMTKMKERLLTK